MTVSPDIEASRLFSSFEAETNFDQILEKGIAYAKLKVPAAPSGIQHDDMFGSPADTIVGKIKNLAPGRTTEEKLKVLNTLAEIADIAAPEDDEPINHELEVKAAFAWAEVLSQPFDGTNNTFKMICAYGARAEASSKTMQDIAASQLLIHADEAEPSSSLARQFIKGVVDYAQAAKNDLLRQQALHAHERYEERSLAAAGGIRLPDRQAV